MTLGSPGLASIVCLTALLWVAASDTASDRRSRAPTHAPGHAPDGKVDAPSEWESIPVYTERTDRFDLLTVKDQRRRKRRVRNRDDWELRRAHVLVNLQRVMGRLPGAESRVPLDVREVESVSTRFYVRKKITFMADSGDRVPAYLLVPSHIDGNAAALLCLHQVTPHGKAEVAGLDGKATMRYAHELAERGYVCIAPDYPSFGEHRSPPATSGSYASGSMRAIWNNIRAIDVLVALPKVDSLRIGAIGHSLGGHNALFTAAFEPRIRAVVASAAFTPFQDYRGGDLTAWEHDTYMPRIRDVYGGDPARLPFDFPEVLAAIAPRALFVSAPLDDPLFDAEGAQRALEAVGRVYRILGANDQLLTVHPQGRHDFPDEIREAAYEWLDQALR